MFLIPFPVLNCFLICAIRTLQHFWRLCSEWTLGLNDRKYCTSRCWYGNSSQAAALNLRTKIVQLLPKFCKQIKITAGSLMMQSGLKVLLLILSILRKVNLCSHLYIYNCKKKMQQQFTNIPALLIMTLTGKISWIVSKYDNSNHYQYQKYHHHYHH